MTPRKPEQPVPRNGRRKAAWVSGHRWLAACAAIVICAAVVIVVVKVSGNAPATRVSPAPAQSQPIRYLGVYEPDAPGSYTGIEQFGQAVGRQPNLVSYYSGWGEQFRTAFADTAASHGARTLVEIDPTNISIAQIAAGKYDPYLASFADEVAAFGIPVIISFGHEMNGSWETWGYHRTSPTVFIAAWRHIVNLFRKDGAGNVIWLWQVNSESSQTGPVRDWWPGARYVTWVGISGYYYVPGNSFYNVFAPVTTAIRQLTQDPVLIAETAVGPQAGQPGGIKDLFAGLRMQHYLGLVWFDKHSYGGLYNGEDWRLEDSRSAVIAFRDALKG